jgi:hypothetical protein
VVGAATGARKVRWSPQTDLDASTSVSIASTSRRGKRQTTGPIGDQRRQLRSKVSLMCALTGSTSVT